jgi:hypothetical protein
MRGDSRRGERRDYLTSQRYGASPLKHRFLQRRTLPLFSDLTKPHGLSVLPSKCWSGTEGWHEEQDQRRDEETRNEGARENARGDSAFGAVNQGRHEAQCTVCNHPQREGNRAGVHQLEGARKKIGKRFSLEHLIERERCTEASAADACLSNKVES